MIRLINFLTCISLITIFSCNNSGKTTESREISNVEEPIKQKNASVKATLTMDSTSFLLGTWKVVSFKDSLVNVKPEMVAEGKEIALSSFYTIKSDSIYSIRSSKTPNGDEGKWNLNKEGNGYVLNFQSSQNKYKDAYNLLVIDANTIQWVKATPQNGKYALLLKKQ